MPGLSDFSAEALLNHQTGAVPLATPCARFLALFTTPPTSDAGSGGTEVSGGSYARQQVAGAVSAAGAISASSPTITMPNISGSPWVVPGMNVYDLTSGKQIGTVLSWVGALLTLTANAANAGSGSTDSLQFSAWPAASASSGSEPATSPAIATNGAAIQFPTATANWAGGLTFLNSWGLYDAATSGNYLWGDYLGAFKWIPFSCTLASPGVLTCDAASDAPANGGTIVVTAKFGGTLPTTGGSWAGFLTTAGLSANSFNAGVNTTSVGAAQFRQVQQQNLSAGGTFSAAAGAFPLTMA